MAELEEWQKGYRLALLDKLGLSEHLEHGLNLASVDVFCEYSEGYRYSSWTYEDPSFQLIVAFQCTCAKQRFAAGAYGPDEVANLIRSF